MGLNGKIADAWVWHHDQVLQARLAIRRDSLQMPPARCPLFQKETERGVVSLESNSENQREYGSGQHISRGSANVSNFDVCCDERYMEKQ